MHFIIRSKNDQINQKWQKIENQSRIQKINQKWIKIIILVHKCRDNYVS